MDSAPFQNDGLPHPLPSRAARHAEAKSRKKVKPPWRERILRTASRLAVFVVAGILFTMSANLRSTEGSRYESDLLSLVQRKEQTVAQLRDGNADMHADIDQLVDSIPGRVELKPEERLRADLRGPGLVVTLNDAPARDPLPQGVTADDLVIHQQDIEAVFNALWAGGAEVIGVQGYQVRSDTTLACVGNVIYIDGTLYSPPYEISAIGPTATMRRALFNDPQIAIIQGYVARYGLGLKVRDELSITVKAAALNPDSNFAKVPEDDTTTRP